MSNVNPFATQITQPGHAATGQNAALSGAKTGVTAGQAGGAFWQFLFSLVGEEGENGDKNQDIFTRISTSPEKVIEDAKNKLDKGQPLSLPELALMLQEEDKDIPVDFRELNIEEVAAKIDELNKTLNEMIASLPADAQANPFAKMLVDRLQHRLDDLRTSVEAIQTVEDEQLVALISFGLSPAQITQAVQRIHDVEEKIGRPLTVEDIVAGVGGILQPVEADLEIDPETGKPKNVNDLDDILSDLVASGDGGIVDPQEQSADDLDFSDIQNFAFEESEQTDADASVTDTSASSPLPASQNPILTQLILNKLSNLPEQAKATDSIAAQLNALNVGAGEEIVDTPDAGLREYKGLDLIARLTASAPDITGPGKKIGHVMKMAFADLIQAAANAGEHINAPKGFFTAFFDGASASADQDMATILPMTHAAQAAHSVTSIPQAGQAHPATQTVSATITKMVKDGGPKSMRIELDPPELGRVHVTLELGKDKTAKIHVLAEKPETYMMLQRDAALLERALQDTGLNTDSASLSFELAEDGSAFNSNEDRDGSGNSDGRRADGEDGSDIIHSQVNWQIDPDTGLTRYNLVV